MPPKRTGSNTSRGPKKKKPKATASATGSDSNQAKTTSTTTRSMSRKKQAESKPSTGPMDKFLEARAAASRKTQPTQETQSAQKPEDKYEYESIELDRSESSVAKTTGEQAGSSSSSKQNETQQNTSAAVDNDSTNDLNFGDRLDNLQQMLAQGKKLFESGQAEPDRNTQLTDQLEKDDHNLDAEVPSSFGQSSLSKKARGKLPRDGPGTWTFFVRQNDTIRDGTPTSQKLSEAAHNKQPPYSRAANNSNTQERSHRDQSSESEGPAPKKLSKKARGKQPIDGPRAKKNLMQKIDQGLEESSDSDAPIKQKVSRKTRDNQSDDSDYDYSSDSETSTKLANDLNNILRTDGFKSLRSGSFAGSHPSSSKSTGPVPNKPSSTVGDNTHAGPSSSSKPDTGSEPQTLHMLTNSTSNTVASPTSHTYTSTIRQVQDISFPPGFPSTIYSSTGGDSASRQTSNTRLASKKPTRKALTRSKTTSSQQSASAPGNESASETRQTLVKPPGASRAEESTAAIDAATSSSQQVSESRPDSDLPTTRTSPRRREATRAGSRKTQPRVQEITIAPATQTSTKSSSERSAQGSKATSSRAQTAQKASSAAPKKKSATQTIKEALLTRASTRATTRASSKASGSKTSRQDTAQPDLPSASDNDSEYNEEEGEKEADKEVDEDYNQVQVGDSEDISDDAQEESSRAKEAQGTSGPAKRKASTKAAAKTTKPAKKVKSTSQLDSAAWLAAKQEEYNNAAPFGPPKDIVDDLIVNIYLRNSSGVPKITVSAGEQEFAIPMANLSLQDKSYWEELTGGGELGGSQTVVIPEDEHSWKHVALLKLYDNAEAKILGPELTYGEVVRAVELCVFAGQKGATTLAKAGHRFLTRWNTQDNNGGYLDSEKLVKLYRLADGDVVRMFAMENLGIQILSGENEDVPAWAADLLAANPDMHRDYTCWVTRVAIGNSEHHRCIAMSGTRFWVAGPREQYCQTGREMPY